MTRHIHKESMKIELKSDFPKPQFFQKYDKEFYFNYNAVVPQSLVGMKTIDNFFTIREIENGNWYCSLCEKTVNCNPISSNIEGKRSSIRLLIFFSFAAISHLTRDTRLGKLLLPLKTLFNLFFLAGFTIFLGVANSNFTAFEYLLCFTIWLTFEMAISRSISCNISFAKWITRFHLNRFWFPLIIASTSFFDLTVLSFFSLVYGLTLGFSSFLILLQTLANFFFVLLLILPIASSLIILVGSFTQQSRDFKFLFSPFFRTLIFLTPIVDLIYERVEWVSHFSFFFFVFSPLVNGINFNFLFSYIISLIFLLFTALLRQRTYLN